MTLRGFSGALAVAALLASACSVANEDPSEKQSDSLVCPACGFTTVCGPGGTLDRLITSFTAGSVASTPSAIEGEPIRYAWTITTPADRPGTSIPVTLDGQPVTTIAGADGVARGSFTTAATFSPSSAPLVHTLSVGTSVCGTHAQTITLHPVAAADVTVRFGHFVNDPGTLQPGQTAPMEWALDPLRITDCAGPTLLGWSPASGPLYPFQQSTTVSGTSGTITVGPLLTSLVYGLAGTCTYHPEIGTRLSSPPAPVSLVPAAPTAVSLKPSSTYVTVGDQISLDFDVGLAGCTHGEIDIVGKVGTQTAFAWHEPTNGSVAWHVDDVVVTDTTTYALTATCHDTGATSAPVTATVRAIAKTSKASAPTCFKAVCKYSGCFTSMSDYPVDLAQEFPPSSDCTAETIDCSDLMSACTSL